MLKPHVDGWNIVLSGHWDALIFTPDWIRTHVASAKEVGVDLPTVAALPPRLIFDGIYLLVVENKLLLGARKPDDAALGHMEEAASRVLKLLPHTPLTATGVNFAFVEEQPGALAKAMTPHEADAIASAKLQLRGGTVRRSALLGEQAINWTLEPREQGKTLLSFNFHFDTPSASQALSSLRMSLVKLKSQAYELCNKLYGETIAAAG